MQKTILGIDPGLATTGWAILQGEYNKINLIKCGSIHTEIQKPELRLKEVFEDITTIITQNKITHMCIEELFFSKNIKTALPVSQSRGVILLACALNNVQITSLNPKTVKRQITGYGNATKNQVKFMIVKRLNLEKYPKLDDVIDAIAIGYIALISNAFG